jgi:hypothetical protein
MATDDYLSAIIDFVAKGQRAGSTGVPPRAIEAHMGR